MAETAGNIATGTPEKEREMNGHEASLIMQSEKRHQNNLQHDVSKASTSLSARLKHNKIVSALTMIK